jgi:hypothetical protein
MSASGKYGKLIARLEDAKGANYALEIEIARAINSDPKIWRIDSDGSTYAWNDDSEFGTGWFPAGAAIPNYTASIDAAITLLPKGSGAVSMSLNEHGPSSAIIGHPYTSGNGVTLAIAICIAALHALNSMEKPGQ